MRPAVSRFAAGCCWSVFLVAFAACSPPGVNTAATTTRSSTTEVAATSPSTTFPSTTSPSRPGVTTDVSPTRGPIVLGFAGDTSFTDGLDARDPFGAVTDLLSKPDFMLVNLETAVAAPDIGRAPVAKPFLFRSPPASLDLLTAAGIDAVSLANNHTLDFGPEALEQTLLELDTRSIPHVGAGVDERAAYEPLIVEVGDWRVGIVTLSRVPCDWSASGENVRPQVAWACPPFVELADAAIAEALEESDVTIVMVHGGQEGVLCPSSFMVELNERWAGLGVDLVVNGHPHVVQGMSSVGSTLVVNSTGNFAFPPARSVSANSGIFLVEISEGPQPGPAVLELRVEPVRAVGGVVTPATPEETVDIFDQINAVSSGWKLDEFGRARRAPEHPGTCG